MQNPPESVALAARVLDNLGGFDTRRHIFLCCDQSKPKCSSRERSLEAWDFLKQRLKQLGLVEQGIEGKDHNAEERDGDHQFDDRKGGPGAVRARGIR